MGLNDQKGNMYGFVTHTWNTLKGRCSHDCSYCHPKGTRIMKADFTQVPIEHIKVGDKIMGIQKANSEKSSFYKFVESEVLNTSRRIADTIKIVTEDGTIRCTPEHPLMGSTPIRNGTDWKSAKSFSPYENLRYITNNQRGIYSTEHRLGYIKGVVDGDGCIFDVKTDYGKYKGFEIVCIDEELINHIRKEFKSLFSIELSDGIKRSSDKSYGNDCKMLFTRKTGEVNNLINKTQFRLNKEFAMGYLAGMIDTDGSIWKNSSIRIAQSKTANRKKYDNIMSCLDHLGYGYVEEKDVIRIKSTFQKRVNILFNWGIFHSTKSRKLLFGSTIKGSKHSEIQSIHKAENCEVFNLQTSSENFIANGFIVHNCYMKRWGNLKEARFDTNELKTDLGSGNFIFVGSSNDLFAKDVPAEWIKLTLAYCGQFNNRYLFQSKNPKRFREFINDFPRGSILCTTIETNRENDLGKAPSRYARYQGITGIRTIWEDTMITIEPVMDFDPDTFQFMLNMTGVQQINIGADTGKNDLPEPSTDKLEKFISGLKESFKGEVFIKDNLKRLRRD